MAADRVNFVNKDDAGRILLALLEQIAHAACTHANKHFYEVRARDGEKRHVGFAGHGACQQGLAGSGRADEQHALRNAPAQFLEFLRLAQELDDFAQLFFGFIHAGNVFERNLLLLHAQQPRPALAEAQRLVAAGLHLPDQEEPDGREQDEGTDIDKDLEPAVPLHVLYFNIYVLVAQGLDVVWKITGDNGVKVLVFADVLAFDFSAGDSD